MFSFTFPSPRRGCVNWSSHWCWLAMPRIGPSSNCSATSLTGASHWARCTTSSRSAVEPARAISGRVDLAGVRIGAHDEIFQAGKPVLVGVDTASTYCYLLSLEEHRDADTWGVRLLDLVDQGFNPEATVADAGSSLRAGQAQALPNVPCQGDIFHIVRDLKTVVSFLENRAYDALETSEQCERRRDRLRRPTKRRRAKSAHGPAQRLRRARVASDEAVALAEDVALLVDWFRHDILTVAGPCYTDRCQLYDFVVAELKARASKCPHRLEPICRALENQRDDLLAFARRLDEDLEQLGRGVADSRGTSTMPAQNAVA